MSIQDRTISGRLDTKYDPAEVETRIYSGWEGAGLFQPDMESTADPFVITIPPPNVTGELHLGHALTYTIEDVLGRYKRMRGLNTLILPGTDHAGIATQNKVERHLAAQGLTRQSLGRDAFLGRAWAWKEEYGAAITQQFRRLGEGYDWSRERFTMDPEYHEAVVEAFVRLYDEGFIYRGSRVINWCPRCRTAISDIEVRPDEREDILYYVRYPLVEGNGEIVVATVRPETMLGDVAVAVHPADERYAALIGHSVTLPLTGQPIPVIADVLVDRDFGTGAVKITPAHDFMDFEVGERHGLPMPIVITPEGRMADDTQYPFPGLGVLEARAQAVDLLDRGGYIVRRDAYSHAVPLCDRCESAIEPLLSEQWFMRMEELAQPAIDVVASGRVTFVPERWTHIYLEWMENIRPWCLSRQLWWGHRIPIYYCAGRHVMAATSRPDACLVCGSTDIEQDPDVLDTWFSSSLWPFATLGWPHQTEDLERFYPTSFMNTSSQILYLWIARMIMMGLHFMGDVPFPTVLINPTILNERGQRMSKSLGTGVDPIELVAALGADATRFAVLASGSIMQQEIRIAGLQRAEEGRNFANKIWNAARFVLSHLPEAPATLAEAGLPRQDTTIAETALEDRWILSRTHAVTQEVSAALERFDLTMALRTLYDFFWSEFADWYVEATKRRLYADDTHGVCMARAVLWSVLERSCRLLHPFMPFITEELWQHLRQTMPDEGRALSGWTSDPPASIMLAPWPVPGPRDGNAEGTMATAMELVRAIRNLRAHHGVAGRRRLSAIVVQEPDDGAMGPMLPLVSTLAGLGPVTVDSQPRAGMDQVAELIIGGVHVYIPLSELTDVEGERQRLVREIQRLDSEVERAQALLSRPAFIERAPTHVVTAERERVERGTRAAEDLRKRLRGLGGDSD